MAANKLSLAFEGADKDQLVAGLAALVSAECGDVSAASMEAAAKASGNTLSGAYAQAFAATINAQETGIDKLCPKPGAGGGGGGGAAAGGDAAAAPVEEKKEEEEVDFAGGMDMFGGGGGGGDY